VEQTEHRIFALLHTHFNSTAHTKQSYEFSMCGMYCTLTLNLYCTKNSYEFSMCGMYCTLTLNLYCTKNSYEFSMCGIW
jgi:hypothetical protein